MGFNKKKNTNALIPARVIKTPPVRFHFHPMREKIITRSQGRLFGEFFSIPISPPPYASAPDNSENRKNIKPILNEPTTPIHLYIFDVCISFLLLSSMVFVLNVHYNHPDNQTYQNGCNELCLTIVYSSSI